MLRVTTAPSATPEAFSLEAAVRDLPGATVNDTPRVRQIIQELTAMGEVLTTGQPGSLWYRTYTELLIRSNPSKRLYLQARPVAAVTSVAYGTEDALTEGTDEDEFTVYPWGLYREDGWDTGAPGWTVVYTGGYWLTASMTGTKPAAAASIDAGGAHLRAAIWDALRARWAARERDPALQSFTTTAGSSATLRAGNNGTMPSGAAAVFLAEGASRRAL